MKKIRIQEPEIRIEFFLPFFWILSSGSSIIILSVHPEKILWAASASTLRPKKEDAMPVIHVHMFEGRTLDQKRKLVAAMTEAVVKSLDAKPETVQILIHENSKSNVAAAGVLHSDKK
jgi:4-oxalocrotonate tautomerase